MDYAFVCNWLLEEGVEDQVVLDEQPEVEGGQGLVLEHLGMLHLDLQVAEDSVPFIIFLSSRHVLSTGDILLSSSLQADLNLSLSLSHLQPAARALMMPRQSSKYLKTVSNLTLFSAKMVFSLRSHVFMMSRATAQLNLTPIGAPFDCR